MALRRRGGMALRGGGGRALVQAAPAIAWAARFLLGAALAAALAGCAGRRVEVHVVGSETMLPLVTAWAEAYEARHPEVAVTTTGGGSGVGLRFLRGGAAHIATASRPAGPEEEAAARSRGLHLVATPVALDAVVVVHPSNGVPHLTFPQLRAIYTGQVTNWRQVGGPDRPIDPIARGRASGTGQIFLDHVFGPGPTRLRAEEALGNGILVRDVARRPGAVGITGLAFVNPSVRAVPLARAPGEAPVLPSEAAVRSGQYPLARPLLFYTAGPPAGAVANFIAFCLGSEGQRLAREVGYIPVQPPP